MTKLNLRYQPVLHSDGTVLIHETIIDDEGNIQSASYEAVRLDAASMGDMQDMLRQIHKDIQTVKTITEDELDAALYGMEATSSDDLQDDNIIDLVEFFAR